MQKGSFLSITKKAHERANNLHGVSLSTVTLRNWINEEERIRNFGVKKRSYYIDQMTKKRIILIFKFKMYKFTKLDQADFDQTKEVTPKETGV